MAKESFEDSSVKCQLLLIAVVFPDTQEMIFLTTFMIRVVSTTSLKNLYLHISVYPSYVFFRKRRKLHVFILSFH